VGVTVSLCHCVTVSLRHCVSVCGTTGALCHCVLPFSGAFDLGAVGRVAYDFFWSDFADWWVALCHCVSLCHCT